jgi:mycothiol synthase
VATAEAPQQTLPVACIVMAPYVATSPAATDLAAIAETIAALQISLYPDSAFSQADLQHDWSDLNLHRDARVVRDGARIAGYGAIHDHGDSWSAEGYVHPEARGHGVGTLIVGALEQQAVQNGALRLQWGAFEADLAGRRLLESLGHTPVRIFRELRIELRQLPRPANWPDGLSATAFDPERDAHAFHAAQQEAFVDHWDHTPLDFETWSGLTLQSGRFDADLWCVVRDGDQIVAGTTCTGDTYGGGWIEALFTRRPWRGRGIGAALLNDAFRRFWERGEHSVGLGVDTANETGAFRIYERAGMTSVLGLVVHEKALGAGGPAVDRIVVS